MNTEVAQPFQDLARAAVYLECPRGPFVVPALPVASKRLSLVVPTFQEAENVQELLDEVCSILDRDASLTYEVIVVDDDSPDGTWSRAARMALTHPAIRVIRRTGESGLATAVIRGYQAATGQILGTINADLQHPPSVLPRLLETLLRADVAVASRFCAGGGTDRWSADRLLLSRTAFQAGRLMLPKIFAGLTDPLSGCYLFQRTVIEGLPLAPMGFKTLIEILARGRAASVAECPYQMEPRRRGISKVTIPTSLSYLLQLRQLQSIHAA
jgi:dolichol-phosphate mannosyltransferase